MSKKILIFIFISLIITNTAYGKNARCVVTSKYSGKYVNNCEFIPEGKGSFSISPIKSGTDILGAEIISVWILSPGKAEVRGLTKNGVSSRWGSAERSTKNKACWIGEREDFKICVY